MKEVEAPRFHDSRHMNVVRLSAILTGHLSARCVSRWVMRQNSRMPRAGTNPSWLPRIAFHSAFFHEGPDARLSCGLHVSQESRRVQTALVERHTVFSLLSLKCRGMTRNTPEVWPYSRCAARIVYILGNNYKFIYFVTENASPIINFSGMAVQ
jgi:hypothetical protein